MTPMTKLQATEGLALTLGHIGAECKIGDYTIVVKVTSAMVNRGYATEAVNRYTYMLNGKRIARTALVEKLSG